MSSARSARVWSSRGQVDQLIYRKSRNVYTRNVRPFCSYVKPFSTHDELLFSCGTTALWFIVGIFQAACTSVAAAHTPRAVTRITGDAHDVYATQIELQRFSVTTRALVTITLCVRIRDATPHAPPYSSLRNHRERRRKKRSKRRFAPRIIGAMTTIVVGSSEAANSSE